MEIISHNWSCTIIIKWYHRFVMRSFITLLYDIQLFGESWWSFIPSLWFSLYQLSYIHFNQQISICLSSTYLDCNHDNQIWYDLWLYHHQLSNTISTSDFHHSSILTIHYNVYWIHFHTTLSDQIDIHYHSSSKWKYRIHIQNHSIHLLTFLSSYSHHLW